MYAQLRTNLPREVMAYTDFAFDDLAGQSKDSRRFPSHAEVHTVCLTLLSSQPLYILELSKEQSMKHRMLF